MPFIDVRVHFDTEDEGDGYTYYTPSAVEMIGSDIPDDDRSSIAESACQSDRYHIDVSNTFLHVLGEAKDLKHSI